MEQVVGVVCVCLLVSGEVGINGIGKNYRVFGRTYSVVVGTWIAGLFTLFYFIFPLCSSLLLFLCTHLTVFPLAFNGSSLYLFSGSGFARRVVFFVFIFIFVPPFIFYTASASTFRYPVLYPYFYLVNSCA